MSVAKKAVDSTIRKILVYTFEIIAAIILMVLICVPLVFSIPMWFQWVLFGTAPSEMLLNPAIMFGAGGAVWVIVFLGLVSFILAYPYLMRISSSGESDDELEEKKESDESPDEETDEKEIEIEDIIEEEDTVEEEMELED